MEREDHSLDDEDVLDIEGEHDGGTGIRIVEPEDEDVGIADDESELVGRADAEDGLSAEEAAVHIEPE